MKKLVFDSNDPQIAQYDYHQNRDKNVAFPSLQELVAFLEQFDTSGCYFRGQAGLWDVVSSLFRHRDTPRYEQARVMSAAALRLLKNNRYIHDAIEDKDHYALAIAQHYGCPTDLIDVTESLRVAEYFASAENDFHQKQPLGCLWVFTKEDLEIMELLVKFELEDSGSFTEYMADMFRKNNNSLLVKTPIPMLSRLNAQKGAFLWDMGGCVSHLLRTTGYGSCFIFRHTPDERKMYAEDEKSLFPLPNQLESEIMRIFNEESRTDGFPKYIGPIQKMLDAQMGTTKDGILNDIAEKAKSHIELELPDLFTPSFGAYPWQQRKVACSAVKPNRINMDEYIECDLPMNIKGSMAFVNDVLDRLENDSLIDYLVILRDLHSRKTYVIEETLDLIHMVIDLNNYSYSRGEIARVLLEYFKMVCFRQLAQNQFAGGSYDQALLFGQIDRMAEQYYGCPVTKLVVYENNGNVWFWLPADYEILDPQLAEEFQAFDKSCFTAPALLEGEVAKVSENAQIFLYQHIPQKIMSYERMRELFIRFVLPQLYAFRPAAERLYIPDYVTAISLTLFGSKLYIL